MSGEDPNKKPLAVDAVKPQRFVEPRTKAEISAEPKATTIQSAPEKPVEKPKSVEEEVISEKQTEIPEPQTESAPEEIKTEVSGLDDEAATSASSTNANGYGDLPSFADQLAATNEKNETSADATIKTPRKERKIFKFLRIIIWLFIAIMLPASLFIIENSKKSSAYADGTHAAQFSFGQTFFWIALIVGILNFIWGTVRWIMRIVREGCKIGRIIGKLIGGGIWRFFVFTSIVLFSLIFIAPAINNKIRGDIISQNEETKNGRALIGEDYVAEKISADEYIKYSLDYMVSPHSLPEQYRGNVDTAFFDLDYGFINDHMDELSKDTLESLQKVLALDDNIDFGIDASGNVSKNTSGGLFTQNVSAHADTVTVLNKAALSSNKKVVVFYTDTGSDAIPKETAENIGKFMEEKFDKAESVFGFSYGDFVGEYTSGPSKIEKIKEVLSHNNIDENALEYAFPVFIAEPYDDDATIWAHHAGRKARSLYGTILTHLGGAVSDEARFHNSIPVIEYILIRPKYATSDAIEETVAHEFGHAVQEKYCLNVTGTYCKPKTLFASEGTANLFSLNTSNQISENGFLNFFHTDYLDVNDWSVGDIDYDSMTFWENYLEIIPDSKNIIVGALTEENQLQYLYDQAGATNFRNVMKSLSQRNITNNYSNDKFKNAFKSERLPSGTHISCGDICTEKYSMKGASTKYIYISGYDHNGIIINVQAPNSTAISIIKLSEADSSKPSAKHQVIKENSGELGYKIEDESVYAIVVANGSIEPIDFILSIKPEKLEDIFKDQKIDFDAKNPFSDLGNGCTEVNIDKLLDIPGEISGFIQGINSDIDLSGLVQQLNDMDTNAQEAKQHLNGYRMSICSLEVNQEKAFEEVRGRLKAALSGNFGTIQLNFFDNKTEDFRISVFGEISAIDRSGSIYALANVKDGLTLFNINVESK